MRVRTQPIRLLKPKDGIIWRETPARAEHPIVEGGSLMAYAEHFLVSHPATLLAVTIILSQAGLPVSSAPLLLLIGALARSEGLDAPIALLMVVPGCVFVDCVWFELGHIRKSARSRW